MRGRFKIGGSLVLSVAVIAGALYLRSLSHGEANAQIVTEAPQRHYIETEDKNQNGVPDWKESLTAQLFSSIEAPAYASGTYSGSGKEYEAPDTLTGRFSEAFLESYIENKMKQGSFEEEMTQEDKMKFVESAVDSVKDAAKSREYSERDIIIIPDSLESFREYGSAIAKIIIAHPSPSKDPSESNEAYILYQAMQAQDPSLLLKLDPQRKAYESIIYETIRVPVPKLLVAEHIALLNSYEAILTDIKAMKTAFTDPLLAIVRLKQYENDAVLMATTIHIIIEKLSKEGVAYANDEEGAFLYLFKK